ncbi:PspC domain-containing protein [Labilibaculum antarcticum]|uniref:PspC domain-containing protein n=1 Tax=Labilibaculum antarcticum TaxID=1717717 RepID=A0A1Y1CFN6_9BACT|nr:PspC domain-containing protein [Labilibaculum antarcticum]BAX79177.1 PspC domain-containing protein [Labilibaculum antarcticum]
MTKRMKRSSDKMIAGVCAGIAEYFGWDVSLVRIAFVLLSLFSVVFPGLVVYVILWFIMPDNN